MHVIRRAAAALLLGLAASLAQAQAYPERAVKFIVPYPAGGIADSFARALGERLAARLGQPVVPENRPGESLIVGTEAAAKSPGDGYTILLSSASSMAINVGAFKTLPYDPLKDFAHVSLAFYTPLYLMVNPEVPAKNLRELIAHAKAKPGSLSFASLGKGSSLHLSGELLKIMAGIDLLHVPYKGTTTALPDLLGGRVSMIFDGGAFLGHARSGKLRLLAVTSPRRLSSLPDVPTMSEAGVPGYEVVIWFGVSAPAATPALIVERLSKEVAEIVKDPALKERFAATGIQLVSNTPAAFVELIKRDTVKWTKLLRDAGVQQE